MISDLDQSKSTLTTALKEWNVAVQALIAGETIVLLRKGGISEEKGRFYVPQDRVLLYPTFEHQNPHLLKPHYVHGVRVVESGWHPTTIELSAWARIDTTILIDSSESLHSLRPFHIWNQQFVSERMKWKSRHPLYLLLLRTYRLPSAVEIPYVPSYGGCRSWISLETGIDVDGSLPVLADRAYEELVTAIRHAASNM